MIGIFVNENGCIPYAALIVGGYKTIETRSRNMLKNCAGHRVAIVRTRRGKNPLVVGYADMVGNWFCSAADFRKYENQHCVPSGSLYDAAKAGKWMYEMRNAEKCVPFELPANTVRHGRSWCEF